MRLEQKASTQSPAAPKEQTSQDQKKSTTGISKPAGPVKTKGQEIVQRAKTDPAHSSQSEEKLVADRKTKEQVPTPETNIRKALSELSPDLAPHRAANLLLSRNGITTTAEEIQRIRSGNSSTAQQQSVSKPQKTSKAPGKQSKVDGEIKPENQAQPERMELSASDFTKKQRKDKKISDLVKECKLYSKSMSYKANIEAIAENLAEYIAQVRSETAQAKFTPDEEAELSKAIIISSEDADDNEEEAIFAEEVAAKQRKMAMEASKNHNVNKQTLESMDSKGLIAKRESELANAKHDTLTIVNQWEEKVGLKVRDIQAFTAIRASDRFDKYTLMTLFSEDSASSMPSLLEVMCRCEGMSRSGDIPGILKSLKTNVLQMKQKLSEKTGTEVSTETALREYTHSKRYHAKGYVSAICDYIDDEEMLEKVTKLFKKGSPPAPAEYYALVRLDDMGLPRNDAGLRILANKIFNTYKANKPSNENFRTFMSKREFWLGDEMRPIYGALIRLGEKTFNPENIFKILKGEKVHQSKAAVEEDDQDLAEQVEFLSKQTKLKDMTIERLETEIKAVKSKDKKSKDEIRKLHEAVEELKKDNDELKSQLSLLKSASESPDSKPAPKAPPPLFIPPAPPPPPKF